MRRILGGLVLLAVIFGVVELRDRDKRTGPRAEWYYYTYINAAFALFATHLFSIKVVPDFWKKVTTVLCGFLLPNLTSYVVSHSLQAETLQPVTMVWSEVFRFLTVLVFDFMASFSLSKSLGYLVKQEGDDADQRPRDDEAPVLMWTLVNVVTYAIYTSFLRDKYVFNQDEKEVAASRTPLVMVTVAMMAFSLYVANSGKEAGKEGGFDTKMLAAIAGLAAVIMIVDSFANISTQPPTDGKDESGVVVVHTLTILLGIVQLAMYFRSKTKIEARKNNETKVS